MCSYRFSIPWTGRDHGRMEPGTASVEKTDIVFGLVLLACFLLFSCLFLSFCWFLFFSFYFAPFHFHSRLYAFWIFLFFVLFLSFSFLIV